MHNFKWHLWKNCEMQSDVTNESFLYGSGSVRFGEGSIIHLIHINIYIYICISTSDSHGGQWQDQYNEYHEISLAISSETPMLCAKFQNNQTNEIGIFNENDFMRFD